MKINTPLFAIALACLATSPAWAMFAQFTLEQIVDRSEVIVVGKIVKVEPPENKDATEATGASLSDTAYILVEKVLKKREGSEIKVGDLVPFSMPSRANRIMSSTDIRYKEGDEGIWMLNRHKESLWASHPMSRQKVETLEEIQAHLKKTVSKQSGDSGSE